MLATLDFKGAGVVGDRMKEDAARARKEVDALTERLLNPPALVLPEIKTADRAGPGITASTPEMLEAWTLECDFDDALVYAGRLSLILLASLRNEALKYVFQDEVTEDALAAEITLGRVLKA